MCLSVYVLPCLSLQHHIGQGVSVYFDHLLFLSPPDKTAIWPQSKTTSPDILDHRGKCIVKTFRPFVLFFSDVYYIYKPLIYSPAICRMVFLQYSSALGMTVMRSRPQLTSGLPWMAYEAKRAVHREPRNPAHRTRHISKRLTENRWMFI